MINEKNIYHWLFDYTEQNLEADQQEKLHLFLSQNPSFNPKLKAIESAKLDAFNPSDSFTLEEELLSIPKRRTHILIPLIAIIGLLVLGGLGYLFFNQSKQWTSQLNAENTLSQTYKERKDFFVSNKITDDFFEFPYLTQQKNKNTTALDTLESTTIQTTTVDSSQRMIVNSIPKTMDSNQQMARIKTLDSILHSKPNAHSNSSDTTAANSNKPETEAVSNPPQSDSVSITTEQPTQEIAPEVVEPQIEQPTPTQVEDSL